MDVSTRRFTGRQIALIVVAVCIAVVAAPVAVVAATNAVTIVDAGAPSHSARVSAAGALSVTPGLPGTPVNILKSQSSTPNLTNSYTVPAGKRLLIRTLSVETSSDEGAGMAATVNISTNAPDPHPIYVPVTKKYTAPGGAGNLDWYTGTIEVDVVVTAGQTVTLQADSLSNPGAGELVIAGYLI